MAPSIPQHDFCKQCQRLLKASLLPLKESGEIDGNAVSRVFVSSSPANDASIASLEAAVTEKARTSGVIRFRRILYADAGQGSVICYDATALHEALNGECRLCIFLAVSLSKWRELAESRRAHPGPWGRGAVVPMFEPCSPVGLGSLLCHVLDITRWNDMYSYTRLYIPVKRPTPEAGSLDGAAREDRDENPELEKIRRWMATPEASNSDGSDDAKGILNMSEIHDSKNDAGHTPGDTQLHGLPKRLLHASRSGSEIKVRLIETTELPQASEVQYLTLTHRWGTKLLPLRLERDRLTEYQRQIQFETLPKTFQDALELTLLLGHHYLWIDALCITQDSEEDWLAEAPRMAVIYSNCVLSLTASLGSDPDAGMLTQNRLKAPFNTNTAWGQKFQTISLDTTDFNWDEVQHGPLFRRAWAFSERNLAPRILHCGPDQFYWEDAYGLYSEDGALPSYLMTKDYLKSWPTILFRYLGTHVTNRSDKLVALAGIAAAYAQQKGWDLKENYLAGLWRSDLPRALLWHSNSYSERPRDDTYVAPTWSWASLEVTVSYKNTESNHLIVDRFRVLEAEVRTVDGNPTSPLISASLVVTGLLFSCKLCDFGPVGGGLAHHPRAMEALGRRWDISRDNIGYADRSVVHLDEEGSTSALELQTLVLCHVSIYVCTERDGVGGRLRSEYLMLSAVDGKRGVFKREGIVNLARKIECEGEEWRKWGDERLASIVHDEVSMQSESVGETLYRKKLSNGEYEIEII